MFIVYGGRAGRNSGVCTVDGFREALARTPYTGRLRQDLYTVHYLPARLLTQSLTPKLKL